MSKTTPRQELVKWVGEWVYLRQGDRHRFYSERAAGRQIIHSTIRRWQETAQLPAPVATYLTALSERGYTRLINDCFTEYLKVCLEHRRTEKI